LAVTGRVRVSEQEGAGETSHELDKRRIRDRISELKARLVEIRKEQERRRDAGRRPSRLRWLATLMRVSPPSCVTDRSDVLVEDKLFATLDTV
jgi:GTP-binding protein HflX